LDFCSEFIVCLSPAKLIIGSLVLIEIICWHEALRLETLCWFKTQWLVVLSIPMELLLSVGIGHRWHLVSKLIVIVLVVELMIATLVVVIPILMRNEVVALFVQVLDDMSER
jgi:hypothetical protein